jgi:hypothetical protein
MTGVPRRWDAAGIRAALLDVVLAIVAAYAATTLTAEVTSSALGWHGTAAEVLAFVHGAGIVARPAATRAMLGLLPARPFSTRPWDTRCTCSARPC